MSSTPKAMTMRIAAELLGGPRQLRIFLRAPAADVAAWLAATREPPQPAFLRALELILNDLDAGGPRLAAIRRGRRQGAQILTARIRGLHPSAPKPMNGAHLRTLQRALAILATRERLAQALRIPAADLEAYLSGRKQVPQPVFLAALDIVARGTA